MVLASAVAQAQPKTVTGTVLSAADGQPLVGATVTVDGNTKYYAITDLDGNFQINNVPSGAKYIIASNLGYKDGQVAVAANVRTFMAEEYYAYWMRTVDAQIRADYVAQREHWDALRVDWIDRVQTFLMDKSLKHNGVSSGAKEYNEVVSLIITLQANGM